MHAVRCGSKCIEGEVTRLHWHVKEVSQIVKSSKSSKQLRKKAKLC